MTTGAELGEPIGHADAVRFNLREIKRHTYRIPIVGTMPLIVNRWSEKARTMMLESQQTKARTKKEPKDPVALFQASKYLTTDGKDGFPATAFKAAIADAARLFDGVTMVQVKQSVVVEADATDNRGDQLILINYGEVLMREDTPRNANGVADLRYRAQYNDWSAILHVTCIADQFDLASIGALVDAAGIGGVGEWRPTSPKSKTGIYGTFEVKRTDD